MAIGLPFILWHSDKGFSPTAGMIRESDEMESLMRNPRFARFMICILLSIPGFSRAAPPGYIETDVDWQAIPFATSARETWLRNRPESYVYDLERKCFCPRRAVRVFVVKGKVVQVEDKQSGEVLTDARALKHFRTLDEYIAWLDHLWRRGADSFKVRRNPHLGYPEEIDIDPTYRMIDEEIQEKITRFRLLRQVETGGRP